MTEKILLRLFITGHTPRSEQAIANLYRICQERLDERYEVEIVDILEQPQLAEEERIIATPHPGIAAGILYGNRDRQGLARRYI